MTDDFDTIANLVPALSPEMMPAYGSNPADAFRLATQLFENAGTQQGQVLLLSDEIQESDIDDIVDEFDFQQIKLSILGIGTSQGAPIPTGAGFLK